MNDAWPAVDRMVRSSQALNDPCTAQCISGTEAGLLSVDAMKTRIILEEAWSPYGHPTPDLQSIL